MTRTLSLASALLILFVSAACEAPGDPEGLTESHAPERLDGIEPFPTSDAPDDDDAPGDDDDAPPGDDDDGGEDDGWDAAPPEWVTDGDELHVELVCGLLDGPHRKVFEKDGDRWFEVDGDGDGPFVDLEPCFGRTGDKFLTWDDTPDMYIFAGGLHHDLTPTATEGTWLGDVYPDHESSRACLDALAARGLTWPVQMQMVVTEVRRAQP